MILTSFALLVLGLCDVVSYLLLSLIENMVVNVYRDSSSTEKESPKIENRSCYWTKLRMETFQISEMSYIVLRGRWCNIILVNVHAPSEEKSEESKDTFYEELEQVFYHFPKYHTKILLGEFNAKVGRESIFKPTIGQESPSG